MRKVSLLFLALFVVLSATAVFAQEPTGSVEGTVTDPQGAVVQNATVTLRNVATNSTRTATANDNGHYSFSQVPPGMYEVKVTAANFKTSAVSDVVVSVGRATPLDVHLEIGAQSETVTVVGGGEVEADRTDNTVSGVVNTLQIQNLPLNGRNFLDLAQLQPGVEKVEGGNFDPTKANYTGVSIAGQAGRSAQIAVDGGSVVDNVVGTTVQNFSQEIVGEFQLGISNYDLSTGASSTGSVNIISKSGGNDFHGNGYLYARSNKWAAFPALSRLDAANGIPAAGQATEIPFDRQQYGGTIGGPIKKDKLFFFFNYEGNNQDGSSLRNPTEAPSFAGFTPNPFDEKLLTAKIDWVVSSKTHVQGRYSFDDNKQDVPFTPSSGIVPRASASGIFQSDNQLVTNRSHNIVLGMTRAISPTLSNNLVFNISDFSNVILPKTVGFPEIRLLNSQSWRSGTNYITPQTTFQERYQLRDDLTKIMGNHTIRVGGNWERTSINGQFAFAKPGRIRLYDEGQTFATEADFLSASVYDISMGIGSDILPFNTNSTDTLNNRVSAYINDSWKIRPRFTMNFGLSYRVDSNLWNHDQGHPPIIAPLFGKRTAASPKDKNNWAPRVGFAWDMSGNGRTVIRGGVGIYYDNTIDNLRLFERADLGKPGAELFLVGADLSSTFFPAGPDGLNDGVFDPGELTLAQALAILGPARAQIEANAFNCSFQTSVECFGSVSGPLFSTEFQVPYSIQYSAGVQRELPWNMLLQADFNYRKGVHEVLVYDVNHRFDIVGGPRSNFGGQVPYADSSGFSTYKALLVRLDRRFSNGFQATASYALSSFKAFGGDTLGLGATVTDLNNIRKEFGPAGLDRRHRFVFSAIYELPFARNSSGSKRTLLGGWQVSMISTAFSGVPVSVFLPHFADLSRSGTFQNYLPGTGPGSLGRSITSVGELNAIITAYNASIPTLGEACAGSPTGRCDSNHPFFRDPLTRLALLPAGTQIGADSLISQDLRVTKTFKFKETMGLDLIGEVFNLFNVANLQHPIAITLDDEGTAPSDIKAFTFGPFARATSVFGTGGPRAFQFAVKFRF